MDKEPWLAVNCSMFLPGLGQCYGEKWFRGIFWFLVTLILFIGSAWSILSPQGEIIQGIILSSIGLLIYLINVFDAHQVIYRKLNNTKLEKIPRTHKNPWFAVFATRIIPGLGHIYLNYPNLGLVLVVVALFSLQLKNYFTLFLGIYPVLTAVSAYDVFRKFPKSKAFSNRSSIVLITLALLFWGLLLNYFPFWLDKQVGIFFIPSDSMSPTLKIGDRLLVQKSANYPPQIGDIIVFRSFLALELVTQRALTNPDETFYIKRIIGTPGARIEITNGKVYLNDYPLVENYLKESPNYQLDPLTVPEGNYFVLGDNRNNSLDSHVWGFLPKQYIVGHAYKIFWPLERQQSLIRSKSTS